LLEHAIGAVAKQFRHDAGDAFKRVGDSPRLLEDFLLHEMAIGAEFCGAGVGMHGAHLALHLPAVAIDDPAALQLQVDHVAIFQVDDLVGRAGQRHRVRSEEVLALADADDQGRTLTRTDHAMRLVAAECGDGIGAGQALDGQLHGLEQVATVEVIDQVGDDFGVGLAFENVAGGLQFAAQFVMVFDDAVVHQRNAPARKMRVRIVRGRRAVGRPARVGDAGESGHARFADLVFEVCDTRGAARTLEFAVHVQGHAAGVVAAVFEALQTFEQDGGDVTLRYCADNAAHENLDRWIE